MNVSHGSQAIIYVARRQLSDDDTVASEADSAMRESKKRPMIVGT